LPTDEQDIATLLWGCESFRITDRDDGVWVVHGHFVVERPVAERGRIAVDTGAYFSGRLSAARITDGAVTFLQV
jgi:serine/threonine protein phosphatase 1